MLASSRHRNGQFHAKKNLYLQEKGMVETHANQRHPVVSSQNMTGINVPTELETNRKSITNFLLLMPDILIPQPSQ